MMPVQKYLNQSGGAASKEGPEGASEGPGGALEGPGGASETKPTPTPPIPEIYRETQINIEELQQSDIEREEKICQLTCTTIMDFDSKMIN